MPEAKFYSSCQHDKKIHKGILRWHGYALDTEIDWKSPLAQAVQADHDLDRHQGHNSHWLFKNKKNASSGDPLRSVGLIAVGSRAHIGTIYKST